MNYDDEGQKRIAMIYMAAFGAACLLAGLAIFGSILYHRLKN